MSAQVITLGCRLNAAESAAMAALALDDDLIIVNSCAVTNEAVRQTRQAIRRAKRARPEARVVVTGCAAQVEPETFAAMPEVSRVVGNPGKLTAASYQHPGLAELVEARFFSPSRDQESKRGLRQAQPSRDVGRHAVQPHTERARAFVAVQNGCDHRCTFCIIPFGRGDSRSVPAGLVVDRVKALVDDGFREVVLTGVDVTSYGPDLPGAPTLGSLVERILKHVPALPRLRLSSLDCIELDERLFDLVTGEARVMPHLHLSLQAGDDMVLKRMKRRHSRSQAVALVERLKARRPELAIGADLIAGFPTETGEMAANSLKLIDDCDIVMGHIFAYSAKRGTPAARMPQVAPGAIKARARALREASARRRAAWLRGMVGTTQRVLVELGGDFGHAENFAPVQLATRQPLRSSRAKSRGELPDPSDRAPRLRSGRAAPGRIVRLEILAVEGTDLIGVPA